MAKDESTRRARALFGCCLVQFHRYFSDYGHEWVHDEKIRGSAEPMLAHVESILGQVELDLQYRQYMASQ